LPAPWQADATEIARAIAARELSPGEVLESVLERIAAVDPTLGAFITVDADGARRAAQGAERQLAAGAPVGPLHGVPVAVKDLEDTAGLRTTYGTRAFGDRVPRRDSVVVERLRAAGAVIVGKTNTSAFGLLGETRNRLLDTRNPWDPTRTTGGSSGGSAAAVAAGMVPLATGTDSAGSITCPAGMCGVFGIKPTHGRVPMWPDAGDSLIFVAGGPLSRTVEDAALLLGVLSGHDSRDPVALREPPQDYRSSLAASLDRPRIACSPDLGRLAVDDEVRAATLAAARVFEGLGCSVVEEAPPVADWMPAYAPLYLSDVQAGLKDFLADHPDEFLPETQQEMAGSEHITGADVARGWNGLWRHRAGMADFFDRYDLLLTPATAVAAFPLGEPPARIGGADVPPGWLSFMPFAVPWNMTGQPTGSMPVGRTRDGLPIGLMMIARHGDEALILRAAAAFEQAQPWTAGLPVDCA
jgi:aspartyl-tRNA(Asn)/glutamyl-tRNA(Gln) amidotransferase subunit A